MANSTNYSFQGNQFLKTCYLYGGGTSVLIRFPSNVYYINYVIGLVLNILLTILAIFLNSVTILAYNRSAQLKSKKSYFLIMLLSLSDLFAGLFGNTSFVLVLITIIIGYPKCAIFFVFEFTAFYSTGISLMTLLGMNMERYLSILHPFYHRTKVTKSKLLKMILVLWLFVIILRLLFLAFGDVADFITSAIIVFIACITLYMYLAIWIKVRRRRPRAGEPQETEKRNAAVRVRERRTSQMNERQNTKMAKSCAIVVVLTYICYTPFAITFSSASSNIVSLLSLWSITLILSSSSLNSLVFFWNNPVLRREVRMLF